MPIRSSEIKKQKLKLSCPTCRTQQKFKDLEVVGNLRADNGGWEIDTLLCPKCGCQFTLWDMGKEREE
jgi:ssDNA-binding Zn-finger/Zn-ribbon topoisomerase 1